MTNQDMLDLLENLNKLKNLEGDIFAYKIISNKKKLKELKEIYLEMISPSEAFLQYDQKREALCIQYCDKDETDKPIIKNNQYQIKKQFNEFNKELQKLNSNNIDLINAQQKILNNGKEFLNESSDIQLKLIKKSEVPSNIKVEQMEIIFDLIEEEK